MCQWEANGNPLAGYRMGVSPTNHVPLTPTPGAGGGVEKSPFEKAAKWLEIDENLNGARLITQFLALNLCLEQFTVVTKTPNE